MNSCGHLHYLYSVTTKKIEKYVNKYTLYIYIYIYIYIYMKIFVVVNEIVVDYVWKWTRHLIMTNTSISNPCMYIYIYRPPE